MVSPLRPHMLLFLVSLLTFSSFLSSCAEDDALDFSMSFHGGAITAVFGAVDAAN